MVETQRLHILVLNQISANGLKRLPAETYAVGKDMAAPDAVLLRSADMHAMDIPASVSRPSAVPARAPTTSRCLR
jgi:D-3-phosphoglycerate dehydrogenase / 2-oxoglutarate reductase